MIGRFYWSVGEIRKEMMMGDKVKIAGVMTKSSVWECWWVVNQTCWVRSSTWMLTTQVKINSWEVNEMKLESASRLKTERTTLNAKIVVDGGGQ